MNDKLKELYQSKWDKMVSTFSSMLQDESIEIKPANPLLLYINDEEKYQSADIRLMIFGQETNGWYDKPGATVEVLQDLYDSFFHGGNCWEYSGQFWNGVSRFVTLLKEKYPGKKIEFLWNNIVKIGKQNDKGFPPDYIYETERETFAVIPRELEILKPDLVVFFTGPNYDSAIKDHFGELKYEALPNSTNRQLARINLSGVPFAYRTYHPNYLWRNNIDDYFNTLIADTNF